MIIGLLFVFRQGVFLSHKRRKTRVSKKRNRFHFFGAGVQTFFFVCVRVCVSMCVCFAGVKTLRRTGGISSRRNPIFCTRWALVWQTHETLRACALSYSDSGDGNGQGIIEHVRIGDFPQNAPRNVFFYIPKSKLSEIRPPSKFWLAHKHRVVVELISGRGVGVRATFWIFFRQFAHARTRLHQGSETSWCHFGMTDEIIGRFFDSGQ